MGSEGCTLKMLFFPFMAQGHILPMVDMAKIFSVRGVRTTILTTPGNAPLVQPPINRFNSSSGGSHHPINLHLIPFPSLEAGLPEECENASSLLSPESKNKLFVACGMLKGPFARALEYLHPDCVVTDMFFPLTCDVASKLNIPRIVFHGISLFAITVYDSFGRYKTTLENLSSSEDAGSFIIIPGIPHRVEMLKSQIGRFGDSETGLMEIVRQMEETEPSNYGTIVNSFYELEPAYVDHYQSVISRQAWMVGPLSLCNNATVDKLQRGSRRNSIEDHGHESVCLIGWLDGQSPGSVMYACFGSMAELSTKQLQEIAMGLEASNHPFIWVVGNDWILPRGFEERTRAQGKGLILKGWAPQILVLNHVAVGGFVAHCGWNSSLEGISAGLPLVTWPQFTEQFYNEKLIVDVLKVGVGVGVREYCVVGEERVEILEAAKVTRAVNRVMGSEDEGKAEKRRERARELGKMAKRATEKGGSSYNAIDSLIKELTDKLREKRDCK